MDCKCEESEDRQEVKEEKEEKDEEEELGAELQTEDLSPAGPSPTEPSAASVPVQTSQCSFYSELLRSAAVCLPGSRDRSGRALLTVCTLNPVWSLCDPKDLLRLLLYYTSTLRKQGSVLGLTVLVDARRAAPNPILFTSLRSLKTMEIRHGYLLLSYLRDAGGRRARVPCRAAAA
ncbi:pleckstrin homology domain-containing family G member 4B-like [Pseudochaenichthys georgianus]|uniref:pleckstrin homology domain-containing family G member 4B-like n=1 Tax=Pseudochaenichthys georgianus TaxID=52239 RepID=UPI0039C14BEA